MNNYESISSLIEWWYCCVRFSSGMTPMLPMGGAGRTFRRSTWKILPSGCNERTTPSWPHGVKLYIFDVRFLQCMVVTLQNLHQPRRSSSPPIPEHDWCLAGRIAQLQRRIAFFPNRRRSMEICYSFFTKFSKSRNTKEVQLAFFK